MRFPKTYTLESGRCRYRIPSEADFPFIASACAFKGFNEGMLWEPPQCEEDFTEPLKRSIESWINDKAYVFTIEDKASNEFIGRIGVRSQDEEDAWDFGYFTHPEKQGMGYMTEAVGRMLKFAFEELGAVEITAAYALWNKASEKVLVNNGFEFSHYIEKGFQKHGKWVDENGKVHYSDKKPDDKN